jgi:hypothetical protein
MRNTQQDYNPFLETENINKFYDLFSIWPVSSIPLNKKENGLVNSKVNSVKGLTKSNFLQIRSVLYKYRDKIADSVGIIDVDFNRVYKRVAGTKTHTLDYSDVYNTMYFQDSIKLVNAIMVSLASKEQKPIDPFLLAKQNAKNPAFDISSYSSGKLVKFCYGDDLPQLAQKYLGNSDKWIEIAIANGLKPPYVDEVGEKIFISSANLNIIVVPRVDSMGKLNTEKLHYNQPIYIKSSVERFPDQRVISDVLDNPVAQTITLTLGGIKDLDKYHVNDDAYIRVFKPNTINSNFFILIPTNDKGIAQGGKELPWFLQTLPDDEKGMKIDLYLDENKSIKFNSSSDFELSYGLANAVQAIMLKITTDQGTVKRHPNFGIPIQIGKKNTQVDQVRGIIINSIISMIQKDRRFDRLENISVEYKETVFYIKLKVKLAGGRVSIPINFSVSLNQ